LYQHERTGLRRSSAIVRPDLNERSHAVRPALQNGTVAHNTLEFHQPGCGTSHVTASHLQHPMRLSAPGKFLLLQGQKFWVKGVTYGTFRPDPVTGDQFPDEAGVARDFALMRLHGINTVRTYTVPPRWLLDLAAEHDLHVMVGIPWEQHIAFLDDSSRTRRIEHEVQAAIDGCREHAAVLCYSIGNEIPASIVRWHGAKAIERFLKRLYRSGKESDPHALITYVNFPTTEYLDLSFLDLLCFNVYLEHQHALDAYLARLHNLAGDRPLILAEVGLDSRRHGEQRQGAVLDWQLRTIFRAGCAGAIVFSWTDEWYRGGYDIEDWDFGLTTRPRRIKPAMRSVEHAFQSAPCVPEDGSKVSVVICTYNGSRTIRRCLEGVKELRYKNYEVVVIDDGSTDETANIVRQFPVRMIQTPNRGLSSARNTGMKEATGEIVAYLDDDAWPDPDWLGYLVQRFETTAHAGIGGPNIPPPNDSWIAECVANAPGGPHHVLLSDCVAEHLPGCNMAFRKSCLEIIGGFDEQYRAAGDDVDVCWRLQRQGWTLGFAPGATVWHHRRSSVRAYWRQQKGYGKAEALLERKWPDKYNGWGSARWQGRIYDNGLIKALGSRQRIFHGPAGSALFQSIYEPAATMWQSIPMMPEWNLLIAAAIALSLLSLLWPPLGAVSIAAGIGVSVSVLQAAQGARRARFHQRAASWQWAVKRRGVTALLHLLQPLARLSGRLQSGLRPWRRHVEMAGTWPRLQQLKFWTETWRAPENILRGVEASVRGHRAAVIKGGDFDSWDLEIRVGLFGMVRMIMGIEEHGGGRQMVLFRLWPRMSRAALAASAAGFILAAAAVLDGAWIPGLILLLIGSVPVLRMIQEAGVAVAVLSDSLHQSWRNS